MAISRREKFDRGSAVSDLNLAVRWKRSHEAFLATPDASKVFGPYFKGLETDFSRFSALMDFNDQVDSQLPGVEHLKLRKLLKVGDLELLKSIPTVDNEDCDLNFHSLESEIKVLKRELNEASAQFDHLSSLLDETLITEDLSLEELVPLKSRVEAFQQREKHLTSPGAAAEILGEKFSGTKTEKTSVDTEIAAAQATLDLAPGDQEILFGCIANSQLGDVHDALVLALDTETTLTVAWFASMNRWEKPFSMRKKAMKSKFWLGALFAKL